MKGYSVRRKQVPVSPSFSLTDYKVQGATLAAAILDLKNDPTIRGRDRHQKFCSLYVQLSRLQSSKGLYLLQKLDMADIQFGPDPRLSTELERLRELEKETIAAWLGPWSLKTCILYYIILVFYFHVSYINAWRYIYTGIK
jgi:hypothetical protein